jgi:alcohol dehydrogenase class IV
MHSVLAGTELPVWPLPSASFGAGVAARLPGSVRPAGSEAVVVVTDPALAATTVAAAVLAALLLAC